MRASREQWVARQYGAWWRYSQQCPGGVGNFAAERTTVWSTPSGQENVNAP
jgi:hypothetical protein